MKSESRAPMMKVMATPGAAPCEDLTAISLTRHPPATSMMYVAHDVCFSWGVTRACPESI